ncbi:hypothetical protein QNO07_06405 [Streptomyces sp. 549]|uniref:hypothetical protein n=1 Tax=Streptomyces sp. 549 TaxID=3049076 RepID=UPI0024C30D65|nr:hypothetical protein [Streptomyces sp. 549]MDK1473054.1 hypothetical protein [Streptomyces sp. 549]
MEALQGDDPRRLGGHRLLGRLGAAGARRTYLGRSEHGARVAVEVFRVEEARREAFLAGLRQEVAAAGALSGGRTAPVLDAGATPDLAWVATAYRPGPPLSHLELGAPLPPSALRPLARELAEALRELRAAGLPAVPLSPARVLLTADGPLVLPALGRRPGGVELGGSEPETDGSETGGTETSEAEAVHALGGILHLAATGQPDGGPAASAPPGTAADADSDSDAEADADGTAVEREVWELIEACLHPDPARRPSLEQVAALAGPPEAERPWLPDALLERVRGHDAEEPGPADGRSPSTAADAPAAAGTEAGALQGAWARKAVVVLAVVALLASLFAVLTLLLVRSDPLDRPLAPGPSPARPSA